MDNKVLAILIKCKAKDLKKELSYRIIVNSLTPKNA